jgi:hypothetical protein
MALNAPAVSNVNGTTDDSFRIADLAGGIASADTVAFQNTTGSVVKLFKANGSTLATLQVATPVSNDDVATKSYVDGAPTANASEQIVAIPLVFGSGATVNSTYALPNNAYVTKVQVQVTTAFDGTGGTVSVGYSGQTTKFMATANNNLKVLGAYTKEQYTQQNAGTAQTVLLTYVAPTGAAAGAADVLVWFVIAPKA